ncbi:KUP/HAK/KT family potassium transporter [Luteolibacter sp. AS25]|uniref:KUP/HAK/KT family potassium transporter n=1 Tax=Luteolibacter sp. AS25 TaxID=3135776 RepID=UPI00398B915A
MQGTSIYMTADPEGLPQAFCNNLKFNKCLHQQIAFLHIRSEEIPRVPLERKVQVKARDNGFFLITAHYGYMETPDVPEIIALANEAGFPAELDTLSFFLGIERVVRGKNAGMSAWREIIFSMMNRNSIGATSYYNIPPHQVLEIGSQLRI